MWDFPTFLVQVSPPKLLASDSLQLPSSIYRFQNSPCFSARKSINTLTQMINLLTLTLITCTVPSVNMQNHHNMIPYTSRWLCVNIVLNEHLAAAVHVTFSSLSRTCNCLYCTHTPGFWPSNGGCGQGTGGQATEQHKAIQREDDRCWLHLKGKDDAIWHHFLDYIIMMWWCRAGGGAPDMPSDATWCSVGSGIRWWDATEGDLRYRVHIPGRTKRLVRRRTLEINGTLCNLTAI